MDMSHLGVLIADATRYESLGRRFRAGGNPIEFSEVAAWLILVAGICAAVWISHQVAGKLIRNNQHSPTRLFRELCIAHRMTGFQRRLLCQLARAYDLPHPVHLYLRPACFETQNIPAHLAAYQSQVATLRETLFGKDV